MSHLAVVTGGTRGIGKSIAEELKNKGFTVIANFFSNYEAAKAMEEQYGIKAKRWNVADFEDCRRAIKEIEEEYKQPVSILVNNAGITKDKMLHKMNHQDWNDVNDTPRSRATRSIIDKNEKHGSMEIVIDEMIGAQGPYEKNIRNFAKKNKDIIELARTKAPQLFVTERNIDLCIQDETHKKDAKDILKLKSSEQFVESCLKKVCPKLDEYKKAQAEKVRLNIKYEPIGMDLMTFEILKHTDEHNDVLNLGNV